MAYTKNVYTSKIKSGNVAADTGEQGPKDIRMAFVEAAREDIRSFPEGPRTALGVSLRLVQKGERPPDSSPVPGLADVFEIRDEDEKWWYRVLYTKKIQDTIYVLHCFKKQSNRIEQKDINTARGRLTVIRMRLALEDRNDKQGDRRARSNR